MRTEQWSFFRKILYYYLAFILSSGNWAMNLVSQNPVLLFHLHPHFPHPLKFDVFSTWNSYSCSSQADGSVANWGVDSLNWLSVGKWDGFCFSISNREYHFEMVAECTEDLRVVVALKVQVLLCVTCWLVRDYRCLGRVVVLVLLWR